MQNILLFYEIILIIFVAETNTDHSKEEMPRRRKLRKVVAPPGFTGYRPYGIKHVRNEGVELLYEEYEAIKLADYDNMNHQQASILMGVSRATFARIYEIARKKIALALVESREITTAYGNAVMDESWHICHDCHARFTIPATVKERECPVCRGADIMNIR
jgi:uncharacterized protein